MVDLFTDLVALFYFFIALYIISFLSFRVYVYAALCDFLCIGSLLPSVLGFCLSDLFSIV